MTQPHVIVLGNEKGGAGKSTLAIHIVTGLLHAGRSVAIIDLDLRQRSMQRFFTNRASWLAATRMAPACWRLRSRFGSQARCAPTWRR